MNNKLNKSIAFFTGASDKSKLFLSLLENGFNIVALILPASDKYAKHYQNILTLAKSRSIPVFIVNPQNLQEELQSLQFDILLSSGYPFMIPASVFGRAEIAINFHPTLLPKYRGRYLHPILINNDQETGVTAHLIDANYDTGPIVKQIKYSVTPFDTVRSLARKNLEAEIELVISVLEDISNSSLHAQIQNDNEASEFFQARTPKDSEIDPNKSLADLFYEIRAYDPELYPAFFYVNGQKVYIQIHRKDKPKDEFDMI